MNLIVVGYCEATVNMQRAGGQSYCPGRVGPLPGCRDEHWVCEDVGPRQKVRRLGGRGVLFFIILVLLETRHSSYIRKGLGAPAGMIS